MNLKEQISNDLKQAMKDKDMVKLNILRVLKGEIERNEQTPNGRIELTDGDIIKLVKKMIEGIKESTKDEYEISKLSVYLPKQLSENEIKDILVQVNSKNIGEVMKYFKLNHDGLYDAKMVTNLIKELV